jgi:hypothetical protein
MNPLLITQISLLLPTFDLIKIKKRKKKKWKRKSKVQEDIYEESLED